MRLYAGTSIIEARRCRPRCGLWFVELWLFGRYLGAAR